LGDGGARREHKYVISADMEQWIAENRAFVVETFSRQSQLAITK
jgi:hypothetical protein